MYVIRDGNTTDEHDGSGETSPFTRKVATASVLAWSDEVGIETCPTRDQDEVVGERTRLNRPG